MDEFEGADLDQNSPPTELQKAMIIWGTVALGLSILMVSKNSAAVVVGASFMAKAFAVPVGAVIGTAGALIGDAIRKFAKPDMVFTSGGMGSLIWTKLFWLIGPQSVGVLIGVAVGVVMVLK